MKIFPGSTNRIALTWKAPFDADDIIDPDIAYFQVQTSKATSFSPVHDFDRYHHALTKSFRVNDADQGDVFYARVRSVDSAGNKSAWIPATTAADGNSNPAAAPDGVVITAGGGGFIAAVFTKPGRLRARHYPYRWTNLTGQTLTFKRARAVVGIKDDPPGSHAANQDGHPTGSAIKMNLRRWVVDESSHAPVFQSGGGGSDDDRLIINAGTHRDTNPVESFNITQLLADEQISVKIAQVGSDKPGHNLVLTVFLEP